MPCELYIRMVDKCSPSEQLQYAQLFQAGDVIAIRPVGWNWGKMEMSSPEHVILRIDDMTEEEAANFFMGREFGDSRNRFLKRRINKIDISRFPQTFRNSIQNKRQIDSSKDYDSVKQEFLENCLFQTTRQRLMDCRVTKQAAEDPFIVGNDPFTVK